MMANLNYVKVKTFLPFEFLKHNMRVYFTFNTTLVNVKFCRHICHWSNCCLHITWNARMSRNIVKQSYIGGAKKFAFHIRTE